MSRLIFDKIVLNADNTKLPEPFIERVHKEVIVPVNTEGNTKEGTTTK